MSLSIILLLFVLCSVSSINLNGTMKIFGNDYITSILVNHTEEYRILIAILIILLSNLESNLIN